MLLHETPEPRQVRRDARYTHHRALGRRVAPRLVVTRKHAQMAPAHELFVIQPEQRVRGAQELWMKNYLDSIVACVEQVAATDRVQDRVVPVVDDVVSGDRR